MTKQATTPPLYIEVNRERWMRDCLEGKQATGVIHFLIINGWGYIRWM